MENAQNRIFIAFTYDNKKQLLSCDESELEQMLKATEDLSSYHRALLAGEYMHEDQIWGVVQRAGYTMKAYQEFTLKK
jgi:hypothetical protein